MSAVAPIAAAAPAGLPPDLDLTLVSRRPARLPEATLATAMALPIPLAPPQPPGPPRASIVVVTYNNLPFTKLCLASVLANTAGPDGATYELIVVDNASADGTGDYLRAVSAANAHVRTIFNDSNRGFATANNQGLAAAQGEVLVLLNNDTIVPPGWLERLSRHLSEPALGLLGPVTNRIGNEAEVEVKYRTYGEYLLAAARRAIAENGRLCDLPTPCMFCFALCRDTYERLGPIDERYEVGLFEDDDYSMRRHAAGRRTAYAEDVLVHHFGEASFGVLFGDGTHGELFRANQRRFEAKWGVEWRPPDTRRTPEHIEALTRMVEAIAATVPPGARVAVISKGDEALLAQLADRGLRPSHFPSAEDGLYCGFHPADGPQAIAFLERSRRQGARFLAVPAASAWWLSHYQRMWRYLGEVPVHTDNSCVILPMGVGARDGMAECEPGAVEESSV